MHQKVKAFQGYIIRLVNDQGQHHWAKIPEQKKIAQLMDAVQLLDRCYQHGAVSSYNKWLLPEKIPGRRQVCGMCLLSLL